MATTGPTSLVFEYAHEVRPGSTILDPLTPTLFTVETAYSTPLGSTVLAGHDTTTAVYRRLTLATTDLIGARIPGGHPIERTVPAAYTHATTATVEIVDLGDLTPGDALLIDLNAITIVRGTHTHDSDTWLALSLPITTIPDDARTFPPVTHIPFDPSARFARVITN